MDLSLDKSIKIGKSDLIDIDCIDQSVESMTHSLRLSIYLDFTDSIDLYRKNYTCSSVHPKMKTAFMQTVNLLTTELQRRVKGSNKLLLLFLKKLKNLFFSLKPALKSSSDGRYWPGSQAPSFFTIQICHPFKVTSVPRASYFPKQLVDKNRQRSSNFID